MPHVRHRKGFVLVITLFLIALIGLVLASMVRKSVTLALASVEAQERLQKRWGSISCRRCLLDNVHVILPASKAGSNKGPMANRLSLQRQLGGFSFQLLLADENAKTNINVMQSLNSRSQITKLTRQLAKANSMGSPSVRLLPRKYPANQPSGPAYQTWEQVFQINSARVLPFATRHLTCWGSGKLNVLTASDLSIMTLCRAASDNVSGAKIIAARRHIPRPTFAEILGQLSLQNEKQRRLQSLLAEQSHCFSLWVTIASETTSEQKLHLIESDPEQRTEPKRIADFSW